MPALEALPKLKQLGLEAAEVEFTYGVRMKNEDAKKIGEEAKKLGILLSVHAPYYINLASKEKEKLEASKQRILESCEKAHLLNARYVVFHAAYYGNYSKEECYAIVKKQLQELQKEIKKRKWQVMLAPETTGKKSQFGTLNELLRLVKEINCFFCIDFAHMKAREGSINYKEVFEKIKHFKHIQVSLKDISDLSRKVDTVRGYKDLSAVKAELMEKFKRGEISLEQYTEGIEQAARMVREEKVEYEGKRLRIKHIANHYYIPVILSDERKRIDYINHIIQTPSEVDFINHLERYLERVDNKFKEFDWWLFSKLDESLDEVYIPYYNPKTNRISQFKPDFIFWLQKGNDYFIIFVDPKGTAYTDYQHKIDGYRRVFEDNGGEKKVIPHEGLNVKVFSFLHTDDVGRLSEGYKDYWFDNMDQVLHHLLR